ncbi:arylesterase [Thermodesulfobacteriota bacterium]
MSPKRFLKTYALLLAGLLLAGCGSPAPRIAPLGPDAVVLAFGDSLTYGHGAKEQESYPAVLERLTGRTVINAGVPGEVTRQGRMRLPGLLDEHRPDLLLLCHGGNDMLKKLGDDQAAGNLQYMIDAARQRGIDVVLIGVPRPGLVLSTAQFYADVAKRNNIACEEGIVTDILASGALKSDYIHPNAAGYRRMAEAVFALLREEGAL